MLAAALISMAMLALTLRLKWKVPVPQPQDCAPLSCRRVLLYVAAFTLLVSVLDVAIYSSGLRYLQDFGYFLWKRFGRLSIAISTDRRGPHVELGEVLLRANKRKQAVEEFDRELSISPHSVRALVRRGEARLLDGELESSLADWTQALATDALYTQRILGLPSNAADTGDAAFEQLPDEYFYHDGWRDGRHDRDAGRLVKPSTKTDYDLEPNHGLHERLARDAYKRQYREAYVRGYIRGSRV